MPIIKGYDISKIDNVKEISKEVFDRQKERQYFKYSIDDIMLVRTTDIFPKNRKIETIADTSFMIKKENFIYSALSYSLDFNELEKLKSYQHYYRSTIHFTENGLVSSHMYGNFDNQSFIILEPLNEQLEKSNFRNFAGQDTFIQGSMALSDKAIIIINFEKYEEIKQNYPEIEEFNIILYKGIPKEIKKKYIEEHANESPYFYVNDERAIVEKVLLDLDYTPELIGSHYIISSPTSDKIVELNEKLGNEYGVLANGKHNYSIEYDNDEKTNEKIKYIYDKILLDFIINKHNIDSNLVSSNDKIMNKTAYNLVDILGVDTIINDIEDFNNTMENMKKSGLLPTNNELLNGSIPNVFDYYVEFSSVL